MISAAGAAAASGILRLPWPAIEPRADGAPLVLVDVSGRSWRVDDVALEPGTRRIVRRLPDVATHRLFTTRDDARAWKLRVAHPFARQLPTAFPFELLGPTDADGQVTAQLLHRQLRWALHYSPHALAAIAELVTRQSTALR